VLRSSAAAMPLKDMFKSDGGGDRGGGGGSKPDKFMSKVARTLLPNAVKVRL
jgi:hypothetical protein